MKKDAKTKNMLALEVVPGQLGKKANFFHSVLSRVARAAKIVGIPRKVALERKPSDA
jgi:hypothetical protein